VILQKNSFQITLSLRNIVNSDICKGTLFGCK